MQEYNPEVIYKFTNEVLDSIEDAKHLGKLDSKSLLSLLIPSRQSIFIGDQFAIGGGGEGELVLEEEKEEPDLYEVCVREFDDDLKSIICKMLIRLTGDIWEIAKQISPIITTLVLTKAMPIKIDTHAVAFVSILIARMGIEGLCEIYG